MSPSRASLTTYISELTLRFHEKHGIYAGRIFKNGFESAAGILHTFSRLQSSNKVVEWVSPQSPLELTLDPGTYNLRFEIYRYASMGDKGSLFASAKLDIADLVPGKPVIVSIRPTALVNKKPEPLGSLVLSVLPVASCPQAGLLASQHEMASIPVLKVLDRLGKDLRTIETRLHKDPSIGMACYVTTALQTYVLSQLQSKGPQSLVRNKIGPSPVEDMVLLVGSQVHYLVAIAERIKAKDWAAFASNLSYVTGRCLFIVFGFVDRSSTVTYTMIEGWNSSTLTDLEDRQLELLILRARMMDACQPRILESLPSHTTRSKFIKELAVGSVSYFAGKGAGDFAGPFIDVILCLQYTRLVVDLLDQWKDYIRDTDKPQRRSGARCLMTYLAQHTHMLPSKLEIADGCLKFSKSQGMVGMMQNLSLQNAGGYAEIVPAEMYESRVKGWVSVAVKAIMGKLTEEDQMKLYREIIASWTLSHPRLLPVAGITHANGGRLSIVTQYMRNGHVFDRARRIYPTMDHNRFKSWVEIKLKQVAEGLKYMHGEHVIHGDVRGPNILLDDDENVVITDFGLSVYADSQSKGLMSTRAGNTRWLAPELAFAQHNIASSVRPTYASDIYSFAMVCFELFTLDVPWGSKMLDHQRDRAIASGQHPPRPPLLANDELWAVVQRCCAFNPGQRPDAEALWKDLKRIVPH